MTDTTRERIWAEVDLGAIVHNFHLARRLAGTATVMPVIKADAYGHGSVAVARALAKAGAARFGVATAAEALELRAAGVVQPILIMGVVPAAAVADLSAADVSVCITGSTAAAQYAAELKSHTPAPGRLPVHLKLDTGMSRLGTAPKDAPAAANAIAGMPELHLEGLFTHFAVSDEQSGDSYTKKQFKAFMDAAHAIRHMGIGLPLLHAANSGAVLRHPETHADMVRPGILLYGYPPSSETDTVHLRRAMTLRARITDVRLVPKGRGVSYGLDWTANRDSVIATVSAGYADGVMRSGSGRLSMLVRGKKAPQVGRVCMDMCMLDVTGIPGVRAGDTATVFGADGEAEITARQVAEAYGTISYEVLCAVSKRVPRLYKNDAEEAK